MTSRSETILELARRYDYESAHAHHVECLAGTLFLELEALHQLPAEDRALLEYAAVLHDLGRYIGGCGHHKHTLQMIMMEPLAHFTQSEKAVIANVARYHRKGPPEPHHTAFRILSEEDQSRVLRMAPLLRVADALDRSRSCAVRELACEMSPGCVILLVGSDSDLAQETDSLRRRSDMFRQVYGLDIRMEAARPRMAGAICPG
jgi:exopolyphosphatase/guanosine-5'-triphosphate,3'-diphosphate pyrophosphatase